MSLEILEAKVELKELVDTFSNLADEGNVPGQMPLFTKDTVVKVYMGTNLVFDINGTTQLEQIFTDFTKDVKRSYHMNGQQDVIIDGDTATGIVYCLVKLVSEEDGKEYVTEHSIRYDDKYIRQSGKWLISERISHFNITEKRAI
jgi:hypothetical protein